MASSASLRLRTLVRALELSDGTQKLAAHLGMRPSQVTLMVQGVVQVPEDVFLRLVDLLISRELSELNDRAKHDKENPRADPGR